MTLSDSYKQYRDDGIAKSIAPEATVERVLNRVKKMKYPILDGYWAVPRPSDIPVYVFAVNDNFRRFNAKVSNTTGKGHIPAQAMASGSMEMVERYACYKYIAFRNSNMDQTARFSDLPDNLFTAESLLSVLTEAPDPPMRSQISTARMAFYRGSTLDNQPVHIPLNILNFFVTTNGMAAGNSLEEALVHALCEVIERHCLTVIRLQKMETPVIDPESITNDMARDLIERLQAGETRLMIRDFSLGFGLPVIGVVRPIDRNNCLVTAGVATHHDEALIRALTESAQADNPVYYEPMSGSAHYFAENKTRPLDSITCIDDDNYRTELTTIDMLLQKRHMTAMYVNTTDDELQIPSVIAVITRAKMDTPTSVPSACAFACALIEESLFLEDYEAAIRYVDMGRLCNSPQEIFMYYEAVCHAFRKGFVQALNGFMRFNRTRLTLGNYYKQRILALSALCMVMTENAPDTEAIYNQLISWDSNSLFTWHEGHVQALSREVKQFRIHILFSYLRQIRVLNEAGNFQKTKEAIDDLMRLNRYCGRLFNDNYLEALILMTIGDYRTAWKRFVDAKKFFPKEPLCDELIRECRKKGATAQATTP